MTLPNGISFHPTALAGCTIYGRFAPLSVRPLDVSPPRRFAPWTFRHLDDLPPRRFATTQWTIRPLEW